MAPGKHAVLSASSAHRWMHCSPSARLEATLEDRSGEAAEEGTAAHAMAEHKLKRALKKRSRRPVSVWDNDEMEEYTDGYVQFVLEALEEARKACPGARLLIEQRLDLTSWIPEGFGTADAVIIADGLLHVIDLKYGRGVLVEADHNPQIMLYALGAMSLFQELYTVHDVQMTIYQPRRESISTFRLEASALRTWAEETLKPLAQKAWRGEGEYCAGPWCLFCRASARCRARAEAQLALAGDEFRLPPLLTDDEIAVMLGELDGLIRWADELKAYALDQALNHEKHWPGWKLVEGRSVRRYLDEEAAAKAAMDAGYQDIWETKLLSITEMEKLMGRKNFDGIMGAFVHKPAGKPTLVPESDKRPALGNAKDDFIEKQEEKENAQ